MIADFIVIDILGNRDGQPLFDNVSHDPILRKRTVFGKSRIDAETPFRLVSILQRKGRK
jgi:hypothetical protein